MKQFFLLSLAFRSAPGCFFQSLLRLLRQLRRLLRLRLRFQEGQVLLLPQLLQALVFLLRQQLLRRFLLRRLR